MLVLLEILCVALAWALASRVAPDPWRGRVTTLLKAWITLRAFWLLLSHPITLEDGSQKIAWVLIQEQLANIDAGQFWSWVLLATGIKFVGMLASMYRWSLVLRGQGIELPFRHIFGSFLIGRAIGTFLPSTAGLDGYTLYDAARFSGRTVEVTAAKLLEKICGFAGIFLSFLVALPFGLKIFGERAGLIAGLTVPVALGVIVGLLIVLWYPGVVTWILDNIPIPGKAQLDGIVRRVSGAAAAYRDKKLLMLEVLGLSFVVHFTTAAMYYFTALAIGATTAEFWPIAFGSSIQILATVLSPFTIAGEGIREAAQYVLLGNLLGPAVAIVSAALGFWAAEAPTMLGFIFWWIRPEGYTPAYTLVNGKQVDYALAAKAALSLETDEERARRHARAQARNLDPVPRRMVQSAGHGMGSGILAGVLIGIVESMVIARGGFGEEAQVLWFGPLAYAIVLGGIGAGIGTILGLLPMDRGEIRGWVPSLGLIATLVPVGLAITVFRLRRDVYLEQMPPMPVLLCVLGGFGILALALFLFGRHLFRSPVGALTRPLPALAVLGGALVAGALTAGAVSTSVEPAPGGGIPPALANRPNIILIMVDTLRADHLSCYGAPAIRTPNMCRLATEGGSKLQGFAHASWTKPSAATLLTSLLPSSHSAMSKPSSLSPDIDTLAEVLQASGYTTGGIVSNINLAASFGFDQGYDEYHYLGPDYLAGAAESSSKLILYQIARSVWFKIRPGLRFGDFYQDSAVVNRVAFDWLERHSGDRFFLFLHYMDPHDPYFEHPYNGNGIARVSMPHPPPELAAEMRKLYAGEIEYLDGNVGEFLTRLKTLGVYDDTVIVLVSDHGEEFHEHDGWWHGLTLYDEQINVPMLIKWSRAHPPSAIDDRGIGRLLDVAPTLVAQAGLAPPPAMQGIDLASVGRRSPKDREVFSEEDHEGNVLWSLRTEEMKLIRANAGNPRGLPEGALFDVRRDPGETRNLYGGAHRDVEAELAQRADLQRRMAEGEKIRSDDVAMTREQCEQLKNLGYVDDCSNIR